MQTLYAGNTLTVMLTIILHSSSSFLLILPHFYRALRKVALNLQRCTKRRSEFHLRQKNPSSLMTYAFCPVFGVIAHE